MKGLLKLAALVLGLGTVVLVVSARGTQGAASAPDWSMSASVIEACSCPMFCQCYFNDHPASHAGEGHEGHKHFCKFNNAYKITKGHYSAVKLDGAKFWLSGDLGASFSKGQMDWNVLTFDKAMTQEQRDAVQKILPHLFPVKWSSSKTAEGNIEWVSGSDEARASIDGGKTAEIVLKRPAPSANGAGEIVMKNLKYWGAPRNDGFVMMTNDVEAYRTGDKAFEFKGTNGFTIHSLEIDSKSIAKMEGAGM